MASVFKRLVVGRPLASSEEENQRVSKPVGLAVFASDAISSTAYATEEILLVLLMAVAFPQTHTYLVPIAVAASLLLLVVLLSYRQTIIAYPNGGRRLRGVQGEPQPGGRPGGRGLAPRRLHPHRRRVGVLGRAGHRLGHPLAAARLDPDPPLPRVRRP